MIGTRTRIRMGLTVWWGRRRRGRARSAFTAHPRETDESIKEPHLHVFRLDFERTLWQKERRTVSPRGSAAATGTGAARLQICRPWWLPGASIWSPGGNTPFFQPSPPQPRNIRQNAGAHLLVEESPEHGQGDVEEQNLQDHLHLGDQKFLGAKRRRRRRLAVAWRQAGPAPAPDTYVVLLLGPVHPVSSLRVLGGAVPEAVLDGKLQRAERTAKVLAVLDRSWGGSERAARTRRHLRPRTCRTSP